MKVLVVAADGTEPALPAWEKTLRSEGVPFDTIVATQTEVSYGTFADGTTRAKYQAVILMSDELAYNDPVVGWTSAFSTAEWDALHQFENTFGIRQVSAYVYPKPSIGLNYPIFSGPINGLVASLTPSGRGVFQYLAGPVEIQDAWGYLALPLSTAFDSLVVAPTGEPIVGVHTHSDGRQELVVTVSSSQWTFQHKLWAHGLLQWVTKGTYLGYHRHYLRVDVDDIFAYSNRWNPVTNQTSSSNPVRMIPSDVDRARLWTQATGIRLDMGINAAVSDDEVAAHGSDPLTSAFLANKQYFGWWSHTYTHDNLNTATTAKIVDEITRNVQWAQARNVPLDPQEVTTGEHSGLDNPNMPAALDQAGVRYIGSDNSRNNTSYLIGPARTVPRHPGNIYYDAPTQLAQLDEYNYRLFETCPWSWCLRAPATWLEYVAKEARVVMGDIMNNDPRPHYVHQANIAEDGVFYSVYDEALALYRLYSTAPITQPSLAEAGQTFARRDAWTSAASSVTAYIQDGYVNLTSPTDVEVPVTGTPVGTVFGGVRSAWVRVTPGQTLRLQALGADSGNLAPQAQDVSASTTEETPVGVTLQASDPNLDPVTYQVTSQPAHGTLSGTAPDLTYTPNVDFTGTDSFTYTASDGSLQSNTATATVDVTEANDPPVADEKSIGGLRKNATSRITLSGSDTDSSSITFRIATLPSNGVLGPVGASQCTAQGSGSVCTADVDYTPRNGFGGQDSFTYVASDGSAESAPATVQLTITSTPPTAQDQSVTTDEDTPVAITLQASDPDGGSLTYTIVMQPSHGTLSGNAPSLTYTPDQDYAGPDSFTFRARDVDGDSNTATVSITVTAVNDAPVADPKSVAGAHQGGPKPITLSGSDTDSASLTFRVTTQPANGQLALSGGPACVAQGSGVACTQNATYTPNAGFAGADAFAYVTNDGNADSEAAAVDVVVVNSAPVALDQNVEVFESSPLGVDLSATDADGDALSFTVLVPPQHGTLSGTVPFLTYTPVTGYTGSDSFTFKANDGVVDSNVATVSISVVKGRVVFASLRDGNYEIYSATLGGGDLRRLTVNGAVDGEPSLSPDGTKVAFSSNRDGNFEIYVMNVDGTGLKRLTRYTGSDQEPTWSPDGSQIAFTRIVNVKRVGYRPHIYTIPLSGRGLKALTSGDSYDYDPAWSPNGQTIALWRGSSTGDILTVPAAGGTATVRIGGADDQRDPSWSPDGSLIAYTKLVNGSGDVVTARTSDWKGEQVLVGGSQSDTEPDWVPANGGLVFTSGRDGNKEVYRVTANGLTLTRVTNNPATDERPSS